MNLFFSICGLFAFLLATAYFLVPRGVPLHEVLHLPAFWLNIYKVDTSRLKERRMAYGTHPKQYFLFIPPSDGEIQTNKIIVYFHGGGWTFGRPEHFKASILPFHQLGYPVILPSVRRTPRFGYQDIRADLNQLLSAILEFKKKQGWENWQLILGGMSSGGNLAALLCFDRQALMAIRQDQSQFAGLLVLGAPLDLRKMHNSLVLRAFAGNRQSSQFRLANPVEHLADSKAIPSLCVHGDRDGLVEYASALSFSKTFEEHHPGSLELLSIPGGTHLEVASWSFSNSPLEAQIITWLKKL